MRMIVYEGTPAEIREVQKGFIEAGAQLVSVAQGTGGNAKGTSGTSSVEDRVWAPVGLAYAALTRIRLSRQQRDVVVTIYDAHPNWVLATTLQQKIGYSASQFAGLMGAFGRRFTHTDGYVADMWFFDQEWNYDEGCVQYRLPDSVRQAVEKAKLA